METLEEAIVENLVFNDEYARRSCVHLKEEYFQLEHTRIAFKLFWKYFGERGRIPSIDELKVELDVLPNITQGAFTDTKEFLNNLKTPSKSADLKWLLEKTEEFCKKRAIYNIIVSAAERIDGRPENMGDLPEQLQDALGITFDTRIGHDYVGDVESRYEMLYRNQDSKIPFDLKILNKIFNGGLSPKTLNVIAAGTGAGKTLFLCHLAQHLFKAGHKVLYITLEMAEERISERIDANIMDTSLADLPLLTKEQYKTRFEKGCGSNAGKLVIKEYPTCGANVSNFRALLNDLKLKKAFVPDVLIVDYINIVASQRNIPIANSYQYVKSVCEELRGLAIELGIPIFSSTQFNRGGTDASDVGLHDISESHGLSMTVDVLLGMIRTEAMDSENLILIKQLKNRFSDITQDLRFTLGVDRSKMRLFDSEKKIGGAGATQKELIDPARNPSSQGFSVGLKKRVVNAGDFKI